jgi:hypothetical protein
VSQTLVLAQTQKCNIKRAQLVHTRGAYHPCELQTLQAQADRHHHVLQSATARLEQRLQAAEQRHREQTSELLQVVAGLRAALEDRRAESTEQQHSEQQRQSQILQAAERQAGTAQKHADALAVQLFEARSALEVQHAALQQQLELICADMDRSMSDQGAILKQSQAKEKQLCGQVVKLAAQMEMLQRQNEVLQQAGERQQLEAETFKVGRIGCSRGQQAQIATWVRVATHMLSFTDASSLHAGRAGKPGLCYQANCA